MAEEIPFLIDDLDGKIINLPKQYKHQKIIAIKESGYGMSYSAAILAQRMMWGERKNEKNDTIK